MSDRCLLIAMIFNDFILFAGGYFFGVRDGWMKRVNHGDKKSK